MHTSTPPIALKAVVYAAVLAFIALCIAMVVLQLCLDRAKKRLDAWLLRPRIRPYRQCRTKQVSTHM